MDQKADDAFTATLDARRVEVASVAEAEKKLAYSVKRRDDLARNAANYRAKRRVGAKARAEEDARAVDPDDVAALVEELHKALGPEEPRPSAERIRKEVAELKRWLSAGGKRQDQIRSHAKEFMLSRIALIKARDDLGADLTYALFATYLDRELGGEWTKEMARTRMAALRRLERPDGPWEEA